MFFFFKQKTAYEMRISDWSSDVCSSDLVPEKAGPVMGQLIALTRSMIDKSRAVEAQMRESQKHTKLLKKNLEHARKAAEQDHLTGLPNRRAFESTLREAAVRARDKGKIGRAHV